MVVNALATIGALALVTHALLFYWQGTLFGELVTMPSDARVTAAILSPNKLFKVVQFNQTGGANVSFYCFDFVSVIQSRLADIKAWGEGRFIAESSCEGIGKIVWKADDELVIPINATIGSMGIDAMKLKGYAQDGAIHIDYPEIK